MPSPPQEQATSSKANKQPDATPTPLPATAENTFWKSFDVLLSDLLEKKCLIAPERMRPLYEQLLAWKPHITREEWSDLIHHKKAGCADYGPYDCIRDGVLVLLTGWRATEADERNFWEEREEERR